MEDDHIRRAQGGDQAAFRALVEHYTPVAWRMARALLADRGAAEDALQDAWLDIWRAAPRLDPTRPFRPWLLTVVANRCRMLARRRSLPLAPLDDVLAERLADETSERAYDAYGMAATSATDDASLGAALAALTTEQQRLLTLRYHADLDLNQMAQGLG